MAVPDVPSVVFVDEAAQAVAALRAGARAVLRRHAIDDLPAAIAAIAAGLIVLDPALDGILGATDRGRTPAIEPLTPREREVLTLLADGLGNKVIAARLAISDHTVKAHLAAIFDKLSVGTRAEAVALGLRRGLIAL